MASDTLFAMPARWRQGGSARLIKLVACAALAGGAMLLALRFDRFLFDHVDNPHGVNGWLYALVRQLGEMPTWLVIALLVMIFDALRPTRRTWLGSFERGLVVIWAPLLAGITTAGIKLLVRRERPDAHTGEYVFRPWDEMTWDTSDLGFPSGHAAVAFGGAWILSMLYPKLAPVWLLGATLCGLSRLMTQAHFFSDVVGAAVLGFVCAWMIWTIYQRWCADRDPVLVRWWRMLQRVHARTDHEFAR